MEILVKRAIFLIWLPILATRKVRNLLQAAGWPNQLGSDIIYQMKRYIPSEIEPKWQKKWDEKKIYQVELKAPSKKPFYLLIEFPYPSGDLHIGHWFTFAMPDILARLKRMQGFNVFMPVGFDAFGLPAENAAIKRGIDPETWTMSNIASMNKQFKLMGASHDYEHQVITCLPEYYKWNQWLFLKLYEKGLAYQGKFLSNWCPSCQTVLANEGVESGKCWRCASEVVQKEIAQWFLKITDYADRLEWPKLDNKGFSNGVDWPQSVREGQNNWIGRSEGLIFTAPVKDSDLKIQTFSAHFEAYKADTFVVIAPDHPILEELIDDVPNKKEIMAFANKLINKRKDRDYAMGDKEIEGIFTGKYIVDPVGNGDLPIWVASYALKDYGTGIVKCSAHDERDFAFAKKYGIRLKTVLFPPDADLRSKVASLDVCYTDMKSGVLSEPEEFRDIQIDKIRLEIMDFVIKKGLAERTAQYHLHDWSISRQRYWGTPVPMIRCEDCGVVPVPEEDLPVVLPKGVDYAPKGKPPLATAPDEWLNVSCPKCSKMAKREVETLDTFFDSSWYFLRYFNPKDMDNIINPELVEKWLPANLYVGGAEHTLGHTLYSRFFTKFLHDLGLISFDEYALKRVHHGVILGPDGARMSKSKGNVVNPDEQVKVYGADAVRMYLSFIGPYDVVAPWNPDGINGVYHFLERVAGLVAKVGDSEPNKEDLIKLNQSIKKIGDDIAAIKFNTAVATLMEWLNFLSRKNEISREEFKTFLIGLAPFAPHLTEEIWQEVAENDSLDAWSIHQQSWPEVDEKYLDSENVKIVVQINGKVRALLEVKKEEASDQEAIKKMALALPQVAKYLDVDKIRQVIYVPGKILSLVV